MGLRCSPTAIARGSRRPTLLEKPCEENYAAKSTGCIILRDARANYANKISDFLIVTFGRLGRMTPKRTINKTSQPSVSCLVRDSGACSFRASGD